MANIYGDLSNENDDINIMDDELLELESDFMRNNSSPLKKNLSKSQSSFLDESKFEKPSHNLDWLHDSNKIPETRKSTPTSSLRKSAVRFSEESFDNDILDNMGFDDSKGKVENIDKTKKENILSELFGKSSTETKSKTRSFTDILQMNNPTTQERSFPVTAPKSEGNLLSATTQRKRSERRNSNLLDPLGLFGSGPSSIDASKEKKTSLEDIPAETIAEKSISKAKSSDGLPDWLSGNSSTKPKKTTQNVNVKTSQKSESTKNKSETPSIRADSEITPNPYLSEPVQNKNEPTSLQVPNKIEFQPQNNTILQLQQQESQLLIALQLKKLEERLIGMEQQQKHTINQQDKQIKVLLDEQNDRQHYVQEQISNQQDRINEQIQMILMNPISSSKSDISEKLGNSELETMLFNRGIESIKNKYSEEVQSIDKSYRKQILLLEEALDSVETRLKAEITRLTQYYQSKVGQLESDIELLVEKHKQKIESIHSEYHSEIERISNHHQNMMDSLQKEHTLTVDNIRKNKLLESNVISQNTSYTALLRESLDKLDQKSADIVEIENYLKQQFDLQIAEKELKLKSKEVELGLLLQSSEKQKEILEKDRIKLMSLVESLEIRLSEQTVAAKEAEWDAKSREAKLTAREVTLEREVAHIRDMAEREKLLIQSMRQDALGEHEKLKSQITEERLALAAEKSRVQTSDKLKIDFHTLKTQAEVDAAIQAAQEATVLANAERDKYTGERKKLETEKRNLELQERHLADRELELTNTVQLCERKKQEAAQMLNEAKLLELKYNEQHKSLQTQLSSLRLREKKLAEDKVNLSKERISLHKGEICPVCVVGVNTGLKSSEEPNTTSFLRHSLETDLTHLRFSEDIEK